MQLKCKTFWKEQIDKDKVFQVLNKPVLLIHLYISSTEMLGVVFKAVMWPFYAGSIKNTC